MDFNSKNDQYLDTVRALHQTVISLRSALENSRSEIIELKSKKWPIDTLQKAITALSVENHALRQQIIGSNTSETPETQVRIDNIVEFQNTVESFRNTVEKLKSIDNNLVGQENIFFGGKDNANGAKCVKFEDTSDEFKTSVSQDKFRDIDKETEGTNINNCDNQKAHTSKFDLSDEDINLNSGNIVRESVDTNFKSVDLNRKSGVLYFQKSHITKNVDKSEDLKLNSLKSEEILLKSNELFIQQNNSSKINDINIKTEIQVIKKNSEVCQNLSKSKDLEFQNTIIVSQEEIINKKKLLGEENIKSDIQKISNENYQICDNLQITQKTDDTIDVDEHVAKNLSKHISKSKNSTILKEFTNPFSEQFQLNLSEDIVTPQTNTEPTKFEDESKLTNKVTRQLKFESIHLTKDDDVIFEPISTSTPRKTEDERTITVSINLDIYKKPKKKTRIHKMENKETETNPEENQSILQHSMSTDLLNQELDNIELIFTNEDTKESNLKEEMISIDGVNEDLLTIEQRSGEVSDKELEDDVFNDNFENENQENKYQSVSFEKSSSNARRQTRGLKKSHKSAQDDFQTQLTQGLENAQNPNYNPHVYNSKSDNSLNHDEKSYSFQDSSFENKSLEKDESFDRFEERVRHVETDMSKVGIHDAMDYGFGRRNTCPNPLQYRPIVHREALGKGLSSRKTRPILAQSNAARRESGAQTDISALPNNNWRSESSLAYKVRVGDNFTTLPSKYPHPGSKLRLSEKTTVEARRVLLSDIGFTSMVPELSRSADHLCPNPQLKVPNYGQFLRTPDYSPGYTSQKFTWNSVSPCDSQSRYSSLYPLASPPTNSQAQSSTQPPYRRCSAPVSPCRYGLSQNASGSSRRQLSTSAGKLVRFANGSLPELRSDWCTGGNMGSSDSTDSLIDEAEQYLRRSIDNILLTRNGEKEYPRPYGSISLSSLRRSSAPEPASDSAPPHGWRPFLPRQARDIRLDNWVKVISPEGRVRGGRVRYIGHLLVEQNDQFVGVQLCTPEGPSDGSYNNRRYFQCEPYHGIFVPFKKVIMAWKP